MFRLEGNHNIYPAADSKTRCYYSVCTQTYVLNQSGAKLVNTIFTWLISSLTTARILPLSWYCKMYMYILCAYILPGRMGCVDKVVPNLNRETLKSSSAW